MRHGSDRRERTRDTSRRRRPSCERAALRSGHAVAKQLRKELRKRVNLIGITGGDIRNLPFSGNFDQHAIKPITAAQLYQLIDVAREAIKAS